MRGGLVLSRPNGFANIERAARWLRRPRSGTALTQARQPAESIYKRLEPHEGRAQNIEESAIRTGLDGVYAAAWS
jgi:hypothetical protein